MNIKYTKHYLSTMFHIGDKDSSISTFKHALHVTKSLKCNKVSN